MLSGNAIQSTPTSAVPIQSDRSIARREPRNIERVRKPTRIRVNVTPFGPIASSPVVREYLVRLQREIARGRDIVCEGRDQGTVVFPDAACKFFLEADPVERAGRRQREMQARGEAVSLEELLEAQEERDRRDRAPHGPPKRETSTVPAARGSA